MAKVRNMGTSTMRFNQGVVISGSIDTEYASGPGVALVCTGSLEIASNATNSEVIRIMSDGNQREMVFQNQQGLSMASLNTDGNSDLILSGAGSIALSPGMSEKIILATTASDGSIPTTGNDAFLFVSGTIDSRGTATKGAAVFGGDVVVSGTLSVNRSDAGGYSMVTVTTDGKVGIGTDNPGNKLSVGGNMDLGEYLYHKNDTDTFIQFSDDEINIEAGGKQMIKLSQAGTNKIILNNGQADVDLQIKSKGNANVFRTDAFNNSVYFGANGGAGNDNSFWVSGSIDTRGTTTRGTAVFGGDLVVSGGYNLIVSGTKIDGTQQEITSLSKILLDASTGIYVSGSGRTANIKMGSHFNPIAVSGQTSIDAVGESELTVVAGDNMTITTDNSAKSITFNAATGGGWTDSGTVVSTTTATDQVGIGTSSPMTGGGNNPYSLLEVASDTSGRGNITLSQHNSDTDAPNFNFLRSSGTMASPTACQAGTALGGIIWRGYDGDEYEPMVMVAGYSANVTTTNDHSSRLVLATRDTTGWLTTRMWVGPDGKIGMGTSSPSTNLHIASTGDAAILLEADTDNSGETDNAYIKFSQDNAQVLTLLGSCGNAGKDPENEICTDTLQNTMLLCTSGSFPLQLGTDNKVRMTFTSDGKIGIGSGGNGTNPLYGKLQLVQDTDVDEGGITILNSTGARAYRFWVDSSNVGRIDSGNDGVGDISINGVNGGSVGIGVESPLVNLDVAGEGRFSTSIETPILKYPDVSSRGGGAGVAALTVLTGSYVQIHKGVPYSRGVRVSSAISSDSNQWIKIASATQGYQRHTSAATLLVSISGQESSANRAVGGTFIVTAKYTPADSADWYWSVGTWTSIQSLASDDLEGFDPTSDLVLTCEDTAYSANSMQADLWLNVKVKDKHIWVTHLGGSGQEQVGSSDPSFVIQYGQSFQSSITSLGNDIAGTWASIKTSTVTTTGNMTVGGNLAVDTSTLFVDSSSNEVGIGTASPDAVLHVTAATPKVRIEATAGNETGLDLYENGNPKWQIYNDPNVSDVLRFRAGSGGSVDTNDTFTYERVADGEGKLWLTSIGYSDGDTGITIEDGGYLQFNSGVKYSPGVKVNASITDTDNQWINIATTPYQGDNYDISSSTFLVTVVGVNYADSTPGRQRYIVSARVFTKTNSPYYRDRGTEVLVHPLDSEYLDGFDPTTDILLAVEKDSTPFTSIWMKITQGSSDVYVTHMNGSTVDTLSTDIGWTINSGQSWSASVPSDVSYSLVYGDWTSQKMKNFETTGAELRGYTTIPFDTSGVMTSTGEYTISSLPAVSESPDPTPDLILLCNDGGTANSSGKRVVRLPSASENDRRVITIKDADGSADSSGSSTSPIRVTGTSSETIDGSTDYNITTAYGALTVISNGTEWKILSKIDT